jgi:mono/diheme cytochrome c family protein
MMTALAVTFSVPAAHAARGDAAQADSGKTVWDGVYTEAQVERGLAVSKATCSACHGEGLVGSPDPPLIGDPFLGVWSGRSLAELYDKIQTTMPGNEPGTLKPQQVADAVAYILKVNNFPAGTTELAADKEAIKDIRIRSKKP